MSFFFSDEFHFYHDGFVNNIWGLDNSQPLLKRKWFSWMSLIGVHCGQEESLYHFSLKTTQVMYEK